LQCVAECCGVLQCVAVWDSVCVAVCCSVLHFSSTYTSVLGTSGTCSVLQSVAVFCSVLQRVAFLMDLHYCLGNKWNLTHHATHARQSWGHLPHGAQVPIPPTLHCHVRPNTLQHTATHCNNTLPCQAKHTATHCNTLQHTATHCNTLPCQAIRPSISPITGSSYHCS